MLRAGLPSRYHFPWGPVQSATPVGAKSSPPTSSLRRQTIGEATTPQPSPCLPELRRPASFAATSLTATVVLASTASIPVVVVWLVVSTTTVPTWTSTIPVTSVRLVCDTSTSSRTTSGSPSSTWTSCGPSSPSRPVKPTSPAPRRTPSPSSTSSPSATPRSSARAVSPRSLWSSAQDGSVSWLRRRSTRPAASSSWWHK